jgi:hypothetical protein
MPETALTLGPVVFSGFEVPERISFGGKQRLAIHRLPGGGRVVDAMGHDEADVKWSGIFSGPDGVDRARMVDLLRAEGLPLPLFWDGFFYTVLISRFDAEYRNPYWVPYRITCAVVQDETQAAVQAAVSLASDALGDLTAASGFGVNLAAATEALQVAGATTLGTAAYAQAQVAVAAGLATISASMTAAASSLGSSDFPTVLNAAATLANGAAAQGYVARVGQNLTNAST